MIDNMALGEIEAVLKRHRVSIDGLRTSYGPLDGNGHVGPAGWLVAFRIHDDSGARAQTHVHFCETLADVFDKIFKEAGA